MNLHFRLAEPSDLDKVFQVFESAIQNMISQDILQWDEIYPQKSDLRRDILKKELYIGLLDDEIACVYVLNNECDEQYKNGNWEFPDASYKVVHRLCVDPRFQNRGVGRETVKHIEEAIRKMGIESIRLDAFTQNPFSLRMYEKAGYKIVGHADWRKGRFYLMEKSLVLKADD